MDAELAKLSPYKTVVAALEEAAQLPGADEAAFEIAQTRFTITLVYNRPVAEVESAMRAQLALEDQPWRRSIVTGAAYAAHPELVAYFDASVAELEAAPRSPTIERALEAAARCRALVLARQEST